MASTPSSEPPPLWRLIPMGRLMGRCRNAPTIWWGASARSRSGVPAMSGAQAPATAARRRRHRVVRCVPLGSARLRNAHTDRLPLLLLGIPLWVLVAYGHRLYHLDRYRAGYGAADDIQPLATHVEGEGRWNRCCRVEANPAPPNPWSCQRGREIERPLRRLRYDTGPRDGLFERHTHAATYAGKATVAAYATRAERTRASPLCCHARAVSVGARPWVMDVR